MVEPKKRPACDYSHLIPRFKAKKPTGPEVGEFLKPFKLHELALGIKYLVDKNLVDCHKSSCETPL